METIKIEGLIVCLGVFIENITKGQLIGIHFVIRSDNTPCEVLQKEQAKLEYSDQLAQEHDWNFQQDNIIITIFYKPDNKPEGIYAQNQDINTVKHFFLNKGIPDIKILQQIIKTSSKIYIPKNLPLPVDEPMPLAIKGAWKRKPRDPNIPPPPPPPED